MRPALVRSAGGPASAPARRACGFAGLGCILPAICAPSPLSRPGSCSLPSACPRTSSSPPGARSSPGSTRRRSGAWGRTPALTARRNRRGRGRGPRSQGRRRSALCPRRNGRDKLRRLDVLGGVGDGDRRVPLRAVRPFLRRLDVRGFILQADADGGRPPVHLQNRDQRRAALPLDPFEGRSSGVAGGIYSLPLDPPSKAAPLLLTDMAIQADGLAMADNVIRRISKNGAGAPSPRSRSTSSHSSVLMINTFIGYPAAPSTKKRRAARGRGWPSPARPPLIRRAPGPATSSSTARASI